MIPFKKSAPIVFFPQHQRECEQAIKQNKKLEEILTPNVHGDIWISWGQWNLLEVSAIFPKIKEWNIQEGLWLRNNYNGKIITEIQQASFRSLQSLGLTANNIESLEGLCRMNLEDLKLLRLDENWIHNAQSLKKLNCPLLRRVSLDNNHINAGWGFLALLETSALEWVDIEGFPDDLNQMDSLWSLVKIKGRNMDKILMRSRVRVQPEQALVSCLSRKNFTNVGLHFRPST